MDSIRKKFIFNFNLDLLKFSLSKKLSSKNKSAFYRSSNYSTNKSSAQLSTSNKIEIANETKKLKVVFFGTDLLSIHILKGLQTLLNERVIQEINVITSAAFKPHQENKVLQKKNQKNLDNLAANYRGNQIIEFCLKNRIKYHVWSSIKGENDFDEFKTFDIGVVASFGHLIPADLIGMFPHGIINVHPSLLPRWRGASPLIYSILFGDQKVGVSVMKIMPRFFDIGPIVIQKSVDLPSTDMTSFKLLDYLGNIGNDIIMSIFKDFSNKMQEIVPQSEENITYAHKINSQMFFINWNDQTSAEIYCQFRGLHEISHLKTRFNGKVLKLLDFVDPNSINLNEVLTDYRNCSAGLIKYLKNEEIIAIKCKDGFVGFENMIFKQKLSAKDFYNGYLNNKGDVTFESVNNTIKDNIYNAKVKQIKIK